MTTRRWCWLRYRHRSHDYTLRRPDDSASTRAKQLHARLLAIWAIDAPYMAFASDSGGDSLRVVYGQWELAASEGANLC